MLRQTTTHLICLISFTGSIATFFAAPSSEASRHWGNNSGGSFSTSSNWVGGVVPPANETAVYDTPKHSYTVNFSADAENKGVYVIGDAVTFDLQGHTYKTSVSTRDGLNVYNFYSDYTSKLRIVNGVVNAEGVSVGGREGTLSVLEVVGPQARITQFGYAELIVGDAGEGQLLVDDHAVVDVPAFGIWVGGSPATGNHYHGLVTISNGGRISTTATSYLGQYGGSADLNITSGGSLETKYTFVGYYGGVNNVSVSGASSSWIDNGYVYVGDSTPELNSTASLKVSDGGKVSFAQGLYLLRNGTLSGDGTVEGQVTSIGGTVSPGASPGVLHITGGYTQDANSILNIEVGWPTVGTLYDQLAVTGNATLAGTLNVNFVNGYVPHSGDAFRLITAGGSFNAAGLSVNYVNAPANLSLGTSIDAHGLTLTVIPEPSFGAMVVLAVGIGAAFRRRKKTQIHCVY